jgi:opacity protein-like surface antigen
MRPLKFTVFLFSFLCYSSCFSQSKFEVSPYIGYNSVNRHDIDVTVDGDKTSFTDEKVEKTLTLAYGANVLYNISPKFKAGVGAEFFKADDFNFLIPYATVYAVFPLKYAKPYIKAQLGMTNASTKSSDSYSGIMFSAGAGASFSLSSRLDIYTDISYKYFDFNVNEPFYFIVVGATDYKTTFKYRNVFGSFGVIIHI